MLISEGLALRPLQPAFRLRDNPCGMQEEQVLLQELQLLGE